MEEQVPSFPNYVTVPVWGTILILVLIRVWRLHDSCSSFLLLGIWFRYCTASFHQYTYPPILFGLSLIALTSITMVGVGLIVVDVRALLLRRLRPFYAMISIILISAIANDAWIGGVNGTFKWLYLLVFALAAYSAMRRRGSERIFRAVALICAGPIALQWISVPWGLRTTTPDGLTFFTGGYQHQQSLSILLLTFLFVTCLSVQPSVIAAFWRLAIVVVGLVLANYRTALLAAGLPAASLVISQLVRKVVPNQRGLAFVLATIITLVAVVAVANPEQERFADLGVILEKGASLIQPSSYFTSDEQRLLSTRVFLWSKYLESYFNGDVRNIVVGFGPEAWVGRFATYAHNTFISYLYELGLFGVVALLWILISNVLRATTVVGERKSILISCHIGFIVLNLSTMGLWTLEGAILYGLILGYTWHLQWSEAAPVSWSRRKRR